MPVWSIRKRALVSVSWTVLEGLLARDLDLADEPGDHSVASNAPGWARSSCCARRLARRHEKTAFRRLVHKSLIYKENLVGVRGFEPRRSVHFSR